ncbi:hypothetical protein ALC53_03902 [Atta colombica]|uniref:Uncharacterized protein n=1 Tax=Atta colombica TaxID=520822 RepID=A0A195BLY2_9HYME|nr:hypothetical protein ALC53_03902 [Atta colombica]
MINPSATARSILGGISACMLDFDDRNFLSNISTFHSDLETVIYFVKKAI